MSRDNHLTNRLPTEHYRLDPKWLEPYLNPLEIIERLTALIEDPSLNERQAIAANQFLVEYNIRQEGKEPIAELD